MIPLLFPMVSCKALAVVRLPYRGLLFGSCVFESALTWTWTADSFMLISSQQDLPKPKVILRGRRVPWQSESTLDMSAASPAYKYQHSVLRKVVHTRRRRGNQETVANHTNRPKHHTENTAHLLFIRYKSNRHVGKGAECIAGDGEQLNLGRGP